MSGAPPAWRLVLALLPALLLPSAQAEEYDSGEFVVHYTALSTVQLTPEIADRYGIARSPHRALLNVAVLRKVPGRLGVPVPAEIGVIASNLSGQLKPVAMRRVDEPPAIYFLGELTVADAETVTFQLTVTPEGARAPIRLRLQHQFFAR